MGRVNGGSWGSEKRVRTKSREKKRLVMIAQLLTLLITKENGHNFLPTRFGCIFGCPYTSCCF